MASILALVRNEPVRQLARDELLIEAGEPGGSQMFVLETGRLIVERDGVEIARITDPGALLGEMAVLLGGDHSTSVRAETAATVRVIEDALAFMERTPIIALHVATLACERLERTTSLLVQLRKETEGRTEEQGLLGRIFSSLNLPADRRTAG